MFARLLTLVALLAFLAPAPASALPKDWVFNQEGDPKKFDLSLLGTFGYDLSAGGSAIFGIGIVPQGFIPGKNDSFSIEIDAGATHRFAAGNNPVGFGSAYVGGGVRYSLHLLTWFAPYVAVRGGARFWFKPESFGQVASPYVSGALGAFFYPGKVFALRVEVGYPGIRGGIVFYF